MKFNLVNFNIVILARTHNPTLLNPDFLKNNEIVDKSFTPIPSSIFCTPPVSQITYEEKISIMADIERLTFNDSNQSRIPNKSPIPMIATKYVQTLCHVNYTAVGINFNGYFECDKESPEIIISNKFINNVPWNEITGIMPKINLRFSYNLTNIIHNLEISSGLFNIDEKKTIPSISINSNFHCISEKENDIDGILRYINEWSVRYKTLIDFLGKVF